MMFSSTVSCTIQFKKDTRLVFIYIIVPRSLLIVGSNPVKVLEDEVDKLESK